MSFDPTARYAHASDGQIEPTSDFPFAEIYEREEAEAAAFHVELGGASSESPNSKIGIGIESGSRGARPSEIDDEPLTPQEMEAALRVFTRLLEWVWQNGAKNCEGLKIRAIIACWIFLKHLRPLTLTQIARGFGKKKQSLGRWVDDFKKEFPHIRNPHMKE